LGTIVTVGVWVGVSVGVWVEASCEGTGLAQEDRRMTSRMVEKVRDAAREEWVIAGPVD
jgi:hypothetical protein